MTALVVAIFALTYVGMALGRLPGTRLDRTGIAVVAAFALLVLSPELRERAPSAVNMPTLLILASLMVVSGELELAGFYDRAAFGLARLEISSRALLAVVIMATGALSALLTNDVVVFALTPMLVHGLRARRLDPRPFLLGGAAAANAGSVATIIGNPQNVLIAEVGRLRYVPYFLFAAPIALIALGLTWAVLASLYRTELAGPIHTGDSREPPPVQRLAVARGLVALVAIVGVLVLSDRPAIGIGAIAASLLVSRFRPSRDLLGRIDWSMLLLFVGLFLVTAAISATGEPTALLQRLAGAGVDVAHPRSMLALSVIGANSIGNVPLVSLLLAIVPNLSGHALQTLAVFSTLAGNLFLTGSVANLIVIERAAQAGVRIGFREHARAGVPIALMTLAVAYAWCVLR